MKDGDWSADVYTIANSDVFVSKTQLNLFYISYLD